MEYVFMRFRYCLDNNLYFPAKIVAKNTFFFPLNNEAEALSDPFSISTVKVSSKEIVPIFRNN